VTLPSTGGVSETEPFEQPIFEIVEKAESPFGPLPTEPSEKFSGIFDGVASTPDPDIEGERFSLRFLKKMAGILPGKPIKFVHQIPKIGKVLKSKLVGSDLWIRAGIFKRFSHVASAIKKRIINALSVGGVSKGEAVTYENGIKTHNDGTVEEVSVARRGINPLAKIWNFIRKAEDAEVSKEMITLACLSAGMNEKDTEEWSEVFHKALVNVSEHSKDESPYYSEEEFAYKFTEEDLKVLAEIPDEEVEKAVVIMFGKAVWSTAYVNDLPDSSFAIILPGGKKVDGKTVPRSLRKLPFKDKNGKIDLAHLRAALSRVGQAKTKLSPEQRARAKRKLLAAAKRAGIGKYRKARGAEKAEGETGELLYLRLSRIDNGFVLNMNVYVGQEQDVHSAHATLPEAIAPIRAALGGIVSYVKSKEVNVKVSKNGEKGEQGVETHDADPAPPATKDGEKKDDKIDVKTLTSKDLLTKYAEKKAEEEAKEQIATKVKEIEEKVDPKTGDDAKTGDKSKDGEKKNGETKTGTKDGEKKNGEKKNGKPATEETKGGQKGEKTGDEGETGEDGGQDEEKTDYERDQPAFYRLQEDIVRGP